MHGIVRRKNQLVTMAVVSLFLGVSAARAEQGCPPGMAPIGQAPGPICKAMPGYMGPSPEAQPTAREGAPMPQIQMMPYVKPKAYGIHVTDTQRSQLYSSNFNYTPDAAAKRALDFCQQQTGRRCVSIGTFVDQCQAIAIDKERATFRGLDTDPLVAAREALTNCGAAEASKQCRLWRLPLCSGYSMGYVDGPYEGKDLGRTPDQIRSEIETMTKEISAELRTLRR